MAKEYEGVLMFVSVILPVYNEEKYINSCIQSLISQTYDRNLMEWIIVDGNSTDNTRSIIQSYSEKYSISLLVNERRNTPTSLNMAIQASRGDVIIRFDAHAVFPPDYIEKCVGWLEKTGADNVGGWVETKAEGYTGNAIAKVLSSRFGVGDSSFRTERKSGYVDTVPFGAFSRSVFDRLGLFNEDLLRSEDNDINARIIESGGKVFLSEEIHSVYYCRGSVHGLLQQAFQNGNALFRTRRVNPKAMSVRHFIPFLFFLSLIVLPSVSVFIPFVRNLMWFELGLYLSIDVYFSFMKKERRLGFVTIWLYPIFHIVYGFGSFLGLLRINVY